MVNSGPDDSEFVSVSDDYVHQLQPDSHRYDITVAPDFVISVLPNGIKTWAFIYDFQGRNRRRTLGVFPEMSFADAKLALHKSRQAIRRMDEPTEAPTELGSRPAVLGGGAYVPKQPAPKPKWLLRAILGVTVLIAGGAGVFFLLQKNSADPPRSGGSFSLEEARSSSKAADKPRATAPAKPGGLPFAVKPEKPPDKPPDADPPPTAEQSSVNPATTMPAGSKPLAAVNSADTSESRQTFGAVQNRASDGVGTSAAPATAGTAANNPARPRSGSGATPASRPPAAGTTAAQDRTATATTPATTTPRATTPGTVTKIPEGVTSYGGKVARSVLTSRVQNLEPTDVLGPEISHRNSGFTRVFYFTELREFSDGQVLHRWEHNGETIEEVLLKVQKSWRWRTYSNKDLTPGLTGRWRVSTIDASGKILDTEEFTYGFD